LNISRRLLKYKRQKYVYEKRKLIRVFNTISTEADALVEFMLHWKLSKFVYDWIFRTSKFKIENNHNAGLKVSN